MAKAPAKKSTETKVTRITASDAKTPNAPVEVASAKETKGTSTPSSAEIKEKTSKRPSVKGIAKPFVAMGRYFKGAWVELRQVRWPDRKSTWGMTGALIAFTAFFVVVILCLDFLFSQLFKLILGSN